MWGYIQKLRAQQSENLAVTATKKQPPQNVKPQKNLEYNSCYLRNFEHESRLIHPGEGIFTAKALRPAS